MTRGRCGSLRLHRGGLAPPTSRRSPGARVHPVKVKHDPRVVGDAPARAVLPWIHRVFANAKRWALGVYHGLREKHLQAYLDEFVFRFNRRRTPQAAFSRLLGLAVTTGPHPYDALVASGSKG